MSQMFETDIGSLLPDAPNTATPDLHVSRGVQILFGDTNGRVTALEENQMRLLDLIEKLVEGDKVRAQAFDLLSARVERAEALANLRQQLVDLLRDRVEQLEQERRQS